MVGFNCSCSDSEAEKSAWIGEGSSMFGLLEAGTSTVKGMCAIVWRFLRSRGGETLTLVMMIINHLFKEEH